MPRRSASEPGDRTQLVRPWPRGRPSYLPLRRTRALVRPGRGLNSRLRLSHLPEIVFGPSCLGNARLWRWCVLSVLVRTSRVGLEVHSEAQDEAVHEIEVACDERNVEDVGIGESRSRSSSMSASLTALGDRVTFSAYEIIAFSLVPMGAVE